MKYFDFILDQVIQGVNRLEFEAGIFIEQDQRFPQRKEEQKKAIIHDVRFLLDNPNATIYDLTKNRILTLSYLDEYPNKESFHLKNHPNASFEELFEMASSHSRLEFEMIYSVVNSFR